MKTIGGARFFRGVLFVKDANSVATKDKIYQGKKKNGIETAWSGREKTFDERETD